MADILLDCDDEAMRLRTPGFYSFHIGHALSELGYDSGKGVTAPYDYNLGPSKQLSIQAPWLDISAVYGFSGEYSASSATKINPKLGAIDGDVADSNHSGAIQPDTHYYTIQGGVMMFSPSCNFEKVRIVATSLTGKEEIPKFLYDAIRNYTVLQFCKSRRMTDQKYFVMAREIGGELNRPYTGIWDKALSRMRELTQDQKNMLRRLWDRGNY